MRKTILIVLLFFITGIGNAQKKGEPDRISKLFAGYETLEMTMNNFKYFAGEIGYKINPRKQLRLVIGEVKLSEKHLTGKWRTAGVDGNNVEGYFRIYELSYDNFFDWKKNWYWSLSTGYVNDQYEHMIMNEMKIDNHSPTIGGGIGWQKRNLFGIKHLYVNIALPARFYLNPIQSREWGNTTIRHHFLVNNIWLFIGFNA
ncbi:hypothetical protein QQ008_22710 [Fulvivirgaceae bacterium BMA10]|uniref:DUF3575 domain-containing protein n=1 Tax=Splendidivirga corallicola TaxID=3051826 RepID=A0ABT8KTW6_9BACT|nr:hypothetical protein [Fulvivirgaceae bacterium BMA10]